MAATLDLGFSPRDYQKSFLSAMASGMMHALLIWHRRSGKDLCAWHWMIIAALSRVGNYFYYFPTFELGRRILWNGKTRDGKTFLSFLPDALISNMNQTEMRINLINGSMIQVLGTDDVDRVAVGTSAHGAIFSEYAVQNPKAAQYISPILRETGGWDVYVTTPRGFNHAHELYTSTRDRADWFTELLGIDKTGAVEPATLDYERNVLRYSEAFIQQEYYCSFRAALEGAYFEDEINIARLENRITSVPYDSALPVSTFWDIGWNDKTSIWMVQATPREYRIIDYYENDHKPLTHYIQVLQAKPYVWGSHVAPHDIGVHEYTTGTTRIDYARQLGFNFIQGEKLPKHDQLNAARMIFNRCYFDERKTFDGVNALAAYRAEFDEKNRIRRDKAKDDWARHGADAFMLFATHPYLAEKPGYGQSGDIPIVVESEFDPFTGQSYRESEHHVRFG